MYKFRIVTYRGSSRPNPSSTMKNQSMSHVLNCPYYLLFQTDFQLSCLLLHFSAIGQTRTSSNAVHELHEQHGKQAKPAISI